VKGFQFKNTNSLLKGIREVPKPKKKINWDRLIYIIIFILIIFSLIVYFINKNIFVNAVGEVVTQRFQVEFGEDIRILKYYYKEGDTIQKGDTLFKYLRDIDKYKNYSNGSNSSSSTIINNEDWILKEKIKTQKEINLKYIDLNDNDRKLKQLQQEIKNIELKVYLDVCSQEDLIKYKQIIEGYNIAAIKYKEEINSLNYYLSQLNNYVFPNNYINSGIGNAGNNVNDSMYYIAPVNGFIDWLNKEEFEVNYRQEVLMNIADNSEIFILGFFKPQDLNNFSENEIVNIKFPDGTKSKGKIEKIYTRTKEMPNQFRESADKELRSIVAVVKPLNLNEKNKWKPYYRMSVIITKSKYF